MDNFNVLDLKSSEIGKLCSKPRNEVKLESFILTLMVHICLFFIYLFEQMEKSIALKESREQ